MSSQTSSVRTPKRFEIPKKSGTIVYEETFPLTLHGILPADEYYVVVTKLNRIIAKIGMKKRYSNNMTMTLLLTGSLFFFPLIPLTYLASHKQKEIFTKFQKYFDSVNPKFEQFGVEFVLIDNPNGVTIKKAYIVITPRSSPEGSADL